MDLTDVRWRKASDSGNNGDCVEVGVWRKAIFSGNSDQFIEVSTTHGKSIAPHKSGERVLYLMRDSKDPDGPKLAFTHSEWDAFIKGVKDGEFDLNS
jgi:hypothetical protein